LADSGWWNERARLQGFLFTVRLISVPVWSVHGGVNDAHRPQEVIGAAWFASRPGHDRRPIEPHFRGGPVISARKKIPTTTPPATGTGTSDNPVIEAVAGVPVLRTGTEKALWTVLGDYPGSSAAELAGAAGIGGSTARRILSGWAAAGVARRDRDPDNSRAVECWSPTTDTAEPGPGGQLPQPDTMAQPGSETGSTAAEPADTAPDPVSETTGDDRPASATSGTDGAQCAESGPTHDEPAALASDVRAAGSDTAAADEESLVRLGAGALRGAGRGFPA
jgi:hypothetical protein